MAIYPPSSSPPRSPPRSAPAKDLSTQRETRLTNLQVEAKMRIEGTVSALVKQITPLSEHQRQILFADSSDKNKETIKPTSTKQQSGKQRPEQAKSFSAKSQLYLAEIKLRNMQQLVVTNKALAIGEHIRVRLSANNQLQIIETTLNKAATGKAKKVSNSPATQQALQTINHGQIRSNSKTEARLIANKIQISLAVDSLREALPKQSPASKLIALASKLNALPAAALNKVLSPQQQTLVDAISRIPRTPTQLKNPQTLKQVISNSGIFLENKISQFVKKNTNIGTPANKSQPRNNIQGNVQTKPGSSAKIQEAADENLIRPLVSNKSKVKAILVPKVASRKPPNTKKTIPKSTVKENTKIEIELKVGRHNIHQKTIGQLRIKEPEQHRQSKMRANENKANIKNKTQNPHSRVTAPTTIENKTTLNGAAESKKLSAHSLEKTTHLNTRKGKTVATKMALDTTKNTNQVIVPSKNVNKDQKSILLLAKEIFARLPDDPPESLPKNINQTPDKNSASNLEKLLKPFLQNALNSSTNGSERKESASNKSIQELQQQLLAQLRFSVGATLARLQVLQVQSLMAKLTGGEPSQQNIQQLQTEIPVQYQNSVHQVGVAIEEEWINKEDSNSEEENSKSKRWNVMLSFQLPEKGKFYAKLQVIEESVSVQFWADKIETLKLAEKNIAPLHQELSTQGVQVDGIQCVPGKPPTKKTKLEYSLVDLRT